MLIYENSKKRKKIKKAFVLVSILYFIVLISAVFLNRERQEVPVANLNFFYSNPGNWEYLSFIEQRNLILNIILFIPFGFLVPVCIKWFRKFVRIGCLGFLVSVIIEVVQYVTCLGIFEYDDLFNNTLGTLLGYGILGFCLCLNRLLKCSSTQLSHLLSGKG